VPNGVSALATIAINEGRATRIADYANYSSTPGKRKADVRGPQTLAASEARLAAGIKKRQQMAAEGRMTHGGGGGGVDFGNRGYKKGRFHAAPIYGKPYSKIRAKRKSYKPAKSGQATKDWNAAKFPKQAEMATRNLRTGEKLKGRNRRKKG
jgi:hypothetical protein